VTLSHRFTPNTTKPHKCKNPPLPRPSTTHTPAVPTDDADQSNCVKPAKLLTSRRRRSIALPAHICRPPSGARFAQPSTIPAPASSHVTALRVGRNWTNVLKRSSCDGPPLPLAPTNSAGFKLLKLKRIPQSFSMSLILSSWADHRMLLDKGTAASGTHIARNTATSGDLERPPNSFSTRCIELLSLCPIRRLRGCPRRRHGPRTRAQALLPASS
jgi:hypothetical protein